MMELIPSGKLVSQTSTGTHDRGSKPVRMHGGLLSAIDLSRPV